MADVYEDVDLTEYGLESETIRVMVNATRGFRRQFWGACLEGGSDVWLECVKRVLDCDEAAVDDMDAVKLHRLFVPHIADDGKPIMPSIFAIWDKYVSDRVKEFASKA